MIGYSTAPPWTLPCDHTLLSGHRPALGVILWQQFFLVCYDNHDHYLYTLLELMYIFFILFGFLGNHLWAVIGHQTTFGSGTMKQLLPTWENNNDVIQVPAWHCDCMLPLRTWRYPVAARCPVSKQFLRNPRNRATCLPQCNFYIYMWSQRRNRNSSTISSVWNTWLRP